MFKVDETIIRDEYGRERIFRGWNLCFKMINFNPKMVNDNLIDKLFENVNPARLGNNPCEGKKEHFNV